MQQVLWHDTILDAIGAAVAAAGGNKKVASKLWPFLDSVSAAARLRAALNPDHAQKLDPHELDMIIGLAAEVADDSIMRYLARKHGYELERLSPGEAKSRAKRLRKVALLDELRRMEDDEE